MSSVCAALLLSQASEIDKILAIKQDLALRYKKALRGLVEFIEPTIDCQPNNWLTAIKVSNIRERDEILGLLHDKGIRARASFTPLHTLNFYRFDCSSCEYQYNVCNDDMTQAIDFFNRVICLPSGSNL